MTYKKTIVVVGTSRGIGLELVKELAQNSDHHILALGRNEGAMNSAFGSFENVMIHALDLNRTDVQTQCDAIFQSIDQIDILINNAGMLVNKPFPELSASDISSCYQVNVIGVMQTVQAAIKKMSKAHIVNISSIGGFQGSVKFAGLSAYSTSKAALCSFTELFAEEYKESNIKMNCLCLGAVQTEMLEEAFPGYEAPLSAHEMAVYIAKFALEGDQFMNGKIIPVSLSTP